MTIDPGNDLPGFLNELASGLGVNKNSVNILMYVSQGQDVFLGNMNFVSQALVEAGYNNAYPIGLCPEKERSFYSAVLQACSLIYVEGQQCVLVILDDQDHFTGFYLSADPIHSAGRLQVVVSPGEKTGLFLAVNASSLELPLHENELQAVINEINKVVLLKIYFPVQPALAGAIPVKFARQQASIRIPDELPISFTAIASSLGAPQPVIGIEERILSADSALTLSMLGVNQFLKTDRSHVDLVREAVGDTLQQWSHNASDIDRVIISSHTFSGYDQKIELLRESLSGVGITAPIDLVYMGRCSSAVSAIRMGACAIAMGRSRNILVVLVDVLGDNWNERKLNNGMALFSDGACSFMLSQSETGYRVTAYTEQADNNMALMKPEKEFIPYLQQFSAGFKQTAKGMIEGQSRQPVDFRYLLIGNYNLSVMKNYCLLAGFKTNQLYTDQLGSHAHVFSSDIILNLDALRQQGKLINKDRVFALGTGSYHWGGMTLEYQIQ